MSVGVSTEGGVRKLEAPERKSADIFVAPCLKYYILKWIERNVKNIWRFNYK